ncbi:hypothetical protein ASE85_21700 [Sphingobium sp. Leaf26]|uniref:hypothetical protein n=1 Tax=Sphingobium sp. Leaf26 TaxID=1735693 RepID=UPI000700F169|nr:hypothetical protein [Sphingobium sp. Leaf26]KQN01809.1 hypothetical protein ASE85_21700 [Sphingobium sp. Leaf26]
MLQRTNLNDLSPDLSHAIRETEFITRSYLAGLSFIVQDAGRDPQYVSNHLLYRLSQDLLQSAVSITALVAEGLLNVARRELRFLLEASVKIAAVQQGSQATTIEEKLEGFDKELRSPSISAKKRLELSLLTEADRLAFDEEVGRLYGLASNYVHLSPTQIVSSIEAAKAGVTAGKERPSDVLELNRMAERSMAASLVLLFHSVPEWVAGDWLVEGDGASINWYFTKSRFIAAMDSSFDYKHERQATLIKIQEVRAARIAF